MTPTPAPHNQHPLTPTLKELIAQRALLDVQIKEEFAREIKGFSERTGFALRNECPDLVVSGIITPEQMALNPALVFIQPANF